MKILLHIHRDFGYMQTKFSFVDMSGKRIKKYLHAILTRGYDLASIETEIYCIAYTNLMSSSAPPMMKLISIYVIQLAHH